MIRKISNIFIRRENKKNKNKYIPLKDNRPTFEEVFNTKLQNYKSINKK